MKSLAPLLVLLLGLTSPVTRAAEEPIVNLVGSLNYRYLTSDEKFCDFRAVYSPNDSQILMEHSEVLPKEKPVKLFLLRVSDRKLTPLLPESFPYSTSRAAWSIENTVVFTAQPLKTKTFGLWTVLPNGRNLTQITSTTFSDNVEYPHWYPDGRSIALIDYGQGPDSAPNTAKKITLTDNPAKPDVRPLTNASVVLVGEPSVSPNGQWIALAAQTTPPVTPLPPSYNQALNSIWMVYAPTNRLTQFEKGQGRAPSWSPDGNWVTFESNRNSPSGEQYAIFAKRFPNGRQLYQLTPYAMNAQHAAWSHDGQSIIVSAVLNSLPATAPADANVPRGIVQFKPPLAEMYSYGK